MTGGASQASPSRRPTSAGWRDRIGPLVALLAVASYLVLGFFPYLVSGLVVPPAAVAVLLCCWALGLLATARLARRRPLLTPLAVVAALVFWLAFVSLGSALFGWTA